MAIRRLDHVAISVADLERSIAFYDRFGLVVRLIIEPREDAALGLITAQPRARARIAHLALGDAMIELFQYLEPHGLPPAQRRQADHGLIHLGLASDDVRGDVLRLRAAGVHFFHEPIEFRPGVWVVYCHGPDGEVIELREVPP